MPFYGKEANVRVYSRFKGSILALVFAAALFTGLLIPQTARGSIFVTNYWSKTVDSAGQLFDGMIGEYTALDHGGSA
jgi:hypothetical protein